MIDRTEWIRLERIEKLIDKYEERKNAIMKHTHVGDNPIIEALDDVVFDLTELRKGGITMTELEKIKDYVKKELERIYETKWRKN